MIDFGPPPLIVPPKPALVRPVGYWIENPAGLSRAQLRAVRAEALKLGIILPGLPGGLWAKREDAEPNATATFINTAASSSGDSSFDFGNFNAPASGLMVVVFISWVSGFNANSRTVSDIEIGGVSGTIHVSTPSSTIRAAVASREVSSGNQNVTVTLSGSSGGSFTTNRHGVGVWLVENYATTTPSGSDVTDVTTAADLSLTFTVNGVAFYSFVSAGGVSDLEWTGATFRANEGSSRHWADTSGNFGSHTVTASRTENNGARLVGAGWA